jgi:protein TonB
MTAAAAEAFVSPQDSGAIPDNLRHTQSLLVLDGGHPNYPVRAAAVIVYALTLAAAVTLSLPKIEATTEEPMELVVVPSAVEEPPPEEIPPPEALDETPPPPEALEPVAPIEPPKPIPPKPAPKVERVEKKPIPARPAVAAPTQGTPSVNANAQQSIASNQFLGCMQRAARNAAPDSPIVKHGRVAYRASFGATGALTSFSITSSSGNPTFDAIATRLSSRCGTLPAIGKPFFISGGVLF